MATDGPSTTIEAPEPPPATLDEYRQLWAQERQLIIDALNSDAYGLDADGVLHGPGGFALDTGRCPDDWTDAGGVSNGVVQLMHFAPLSAFTNIGDLALGTRTYFERLNTNGGIGPDGLQVDLQVRDDAYVPEQTAQLVNEALAGPQPFALSTMGTPNLLAVDELVNASCVPLLMGITSGPGGADPTSRPWTTGLRMTQITEATLWAEWIERNMAGPVTVAALVMDNSFGYTYENAFAAAAADRSVIERFEVIHHEPAAEDLGDEMVRIADLRADVFISMTAGNPCLLAMQGAANVDLGGSTAIRFTPSGCALIEPYLKPAGTDGDGWLTLGGGIKDSTSDRWKDDPWVEFVNRELEAEGVDHTIGLQATGFGLRGWAMHQVLEIASNLDGGLTRTNLILAQRGFIGMTHPMLHPGIGFAMNGNQDAYFVEGSQISVYDADRQHWVTEGIIDINGSTPPCTWQPDIGYCEAG